MPYCETIVKVFLFGPYAQGAEATKKGISHRTWQNISLPLSLVVFVAVGVLVGEGIDRFFVSLLGCLLVPLHGFGVVRGEYALDAELVHKAKMELGDCITLVRFLLVRLHGFNVVLGVGERDERGKQ